MKEILDYMFWGNSIRSWGIALGIIIGSIIILRLIRMVVIARIKKFTAKTASTIDDFLITVIQRFAMPLLNIVAIYLGLQYLYIDPRIGNILNAAITVVAVFFILRAIIFFIGYVFEQYVKRQGGEEAQIKQAKGILLIMKVVIWVLGIIFLIDNLGYDITTIVAGLGIGGIAIALAAQTVLGDLFSYLVIFFDKPFETGDFINIGDKMGSVEYIGIKTTRIRALGGEQLIVSNTDLTNSRVQNFKRLERRRIVYKIGVLYETPIEKLKRIPGMIKEIIDAQESVQYDRVHFSGFGDFSLNYEIVYFLNTPDFVMYMDRQQAINFSIMEVFQKEGIEFAYPTQKLFMSQPDSDDPPEEDDPKN